MKHVHEYETVSHHGISPELMEMGIHAAEVRRCTTCHQEVPFLQIRKGLWVPLFYDREQDTQDILMA